MKTQTQKMTQIFSAFGNWAGRGLRYARPLPAMNDDLVQEYEAGVMPVLPLRNIAPFDEHTAN
jgi:hypothetical protein